MLRPARYLVAMAVFAAGAGASAAAVPGASEQLQPGITYTVWTEGPIPARIHVVEVVLTSATLELRATAEGERGRTLSAYAGLSGSQVVVNGDAFTPAGFVPVGLARGRSETWSTTRDSELSGYFAFYRAPNRTVVEFSPPEVVAGVGPEVVGVVGGRPMLVRDGAEVTAFSCDDLVAMPCQRAPRTAVAVSDERELLWLVVVDGWQEDSQGMTAEELARFLAEDLGAHEALMLDGGGSSGLFLADKGGIESSPSDGVERTVANHLAVRYFGGAGPGTLQGVVRERTLNGQDIDGATVRLDTGQELQFAAGTIWSIEAPPRWACVTASAPGFRPQTECRDVPSGGAVWSSVFLERDDGTTPDAGPGIGDGGFGAADAGDGDGPGGCGCRAGGAGSGPAAALVLLLVLAWRSRR